MEESFLFRSFKHFCIAEAFIREQWENFWFKIEVLFREKLDWGVFFTPLILKGLFSKKLFEWN